MKHISGSIEIADIDKLPDLPGVYLLKDKFAPIYVGAANNLRKRLRSTNHDKRVCIDDENTLIEYIITDNYVEIEKEFIDKYKPCLNGKSINPVKNIHMLQVTPKTHNKFKMAAKRDNKFMWVVADEAIELYNKKHGKK